MGGKGGGGIGRGDLGKASDGNGEILVNNYNLYIIYYLVVSLMIEKLIREVKVSLCT